MEIAVFISNEQTDIPISEKTEEMFVNLTAFVLLAEGILNAEVSIALIDDEAMTELNNLFREINKTTDVLSFPQDDEFLLGDVAISVPQAFRQAEEYGHSPEREMSYLLTHGLLHLLGYDHEEDEEKKIMRAKEEKLLSEFKAKGMDGVD